MNPLLLLKLVPLKVWAGFAAAAALGALVLWFGAHERAVGDTRTAAIYEATLLTQRVKAARVLADLTIDKEQVEKNLQDFKNTQEVKDVTNTKIVADLGGKLRDLGRLRDPNQTGSGGGSGGTKAADPTSASTGTGDGTQTDGLLSEQLTELLQRLTQEADTVNNAYASCRADSLKVRQEMNSK